MALRPSRPPGAGWPLMFSLYSLVATGVPPAASLTAYPAPDGAPTSDLFGVSVSQVGSGLTVQPAVFSTSSAARCAQVNQPPNSEWCSHDRTQAWASFWFGTTPATVTITTSHAGGWGDTSKVAVLPRRAQTPVTRVNDSTIALVLAPSDLGWKVSIESPWQMAPSAPGQPIVVQHSLMIFADPLSSGVDPTRATTANAGTSPANTDGSEDIHGVGFGSGGVLRFDAGYHDLGGQMPLGANISTVFIAGGAWLSGGFITTTNSQQVTIVGRGVISGSATPFLPGPAGSKCYYNGSYCWSLVNLDNGAGHVISGVVLHDPPKSVTPTSAVPACLYYFRTYAPNATVRGVKMVGAWPFNTDGVVTGANGLVTDTFIRSNDDSVKLFSSGMTVSNVTVWQMSNGGVFQLGWWTSHSQSSITVRDITLLRAEWRPNPGWESTHNTNDAIVDLRGPDASTGVYSISDITWERIGIETPIVGGGFVKVNLSQASGTVNRLKFRDVFLPNIMESSVYIARGQTLQGWAFTNLVVNGTCAGSATAAGFVSSPPDATFACPRCEDP